MPAKHLKKCSTSLVIREMQIKTTLRFYLTPIRMVKIKNSGGSRCWQGCGKRSSMNLDGWWDCKLVQPLWKSVWQILRKLDIVLLEDPGIPLQVTHSKDAPTYNKDTCSTLFMAALFIIARSWKVPRCSSSETVWYIYVTDYYPATKNNNYMKFLGKCMELENILNEATHSHPKTLAFPYTGEKSLHRNKGFSSYWCQTMPSSARYASGAMGPFMYTLWLVL